MYDKKLAKQEERDVYIREQSLDLIAKKLHLTERTILKMTNEVSPCNCAWEELENSWRNHYKFQASFLLSDLEAINDGAMK